MPAPRRGKPDAGSPAGPAWGPGRRAWPAAVGRALRPGSAPLRVAAALRTLLAAAAIAVVGWLSHHLEVTALAYFGVACSATLTTAGSYRGRAASLLSQATGAVAGFGLGSIAADSSAGRVVVAGAVGFACGVLGFRSSVATAGSVVAVICVGFEQFAGLGLAWWQESAYYLLGAAAMAAAALAPWLVRGDRYERAAVADVLATSATLLTVLGTDQAQAARAELARASAAVRSAVPAGPGRTRRRRKLAEARARAERVALVAAELHGDRTPAGQVPAVAVRVLRQRAAAFRAHRAETGLAELGDTPLETALREALDGPPPAAPAAPPPVRAGLRAALADPAALDVGLKLATCLVIATAVTNALDRGTHSFWIPLTIAVLVRPEYASIFVRTVNRLAGTLAGAALASVVLLVLGSGLPVAVAAAVAISAAVLTAPRLYAFSVVGVTCSALLSASVAQADPVFAPVRLLDTVIGAAIALLVGHVLWPGRARTTPAGRIAAGIADARAYLEQAARVPAARQEWPGVRDRAYRSAHATRAAVEAARLEPPPVGPAADDLLPAAVALEDLVDRITAAAATVEQQAQPLPHRDRDELAGRLDALTRSSRGLPSGNPASRRVGGPP